AFREGEPMAARDEPYWDRWLHRRLSRRRLLGAGLVAAGALASGCAAPGVPSLPGLTAPTPAAYPTFGAAAQPVSRPLAYWKYLHQAPDFGLLPRNGGRLTIAFPNDPPHLDPFQTSSHAMQLAVSPVYNRLL